MKNKLLVSACLLGINSKYNGENNINHLLVENCPELNIIPFCPEQIGGLPTPRNACEIANGMTGKDVLEGNAKVMDNEGNDVTHQFVMGAKEALNIAKLQNVVYAILKKRSPSCGCNYIYDGSFQGNLHQGNGVTAELFQANGIKTFTEDDISEELLRRLKND